MIDEAVFSDLIIEIVRAVRDEAHVWYLLSCCELTDDEANAAVELLL